MSDARLVRAIDGMTLARGALFAAAGEMILARYSEETPGGDLGQELDLELERLCDLAYELERCAATVGAVSGVEAGVATRSGPNDACPEAVLAEDAARSLGARLALRSRPSRVDAPQAP